MNRSHKIPGSRPKPSNCRLDQVTIGTHISSGAQPKQSSGKGYSNSNKGKNSQRGMVSQVMPRTSSRESESEFSKRVNRRDFAVDIQKKSRRRTLTVVIVVGIIALCLAAVVGSMTYFSSISSRMALSDTNVSSVLVAAESSEPYYVLFAGEFAETGKNYEGPDVLMLARIDDDAKQVSLISIPSNLRLSLSEGTASNIAEAQLIGGDEYLINTVADFAGVSISHYVKTDATGFVELVDLLGGISVEIPEEVDDPKAGGIYIEPGTQTLDGAQALTFARAKNYLEGSELRSQNQYNIMVALVSKLLEGNSFESMTRVDSIADAIQTDLSLLDAISVIDSLRSLESGSVTKVTVPGYFSRDNAENAEHFIYDSEAWSALIEAVDTGEPLEEETGPVDVDPTSFTLTVRNGSGIDGGAAQIAELLSADKYRVEETGNTDSYVYDETLVIYKDEKYADAAQSVVDNLGVGRVVASNGFYTFETNVLIVVGKDWKPIN